MLFRSCDGWDYAQLGYTMRGGREMDNHFEVMWDLFRDIPSFEDENVSVLDYYYWLNKRDPNHSLCRATKDRGQDAHTNNKFNLSDKGCMEIMKLFFTPEEELQDKKITEYFSDEVLNMPALPAPACVHMHGNQPTQNTYLHTVYSLYLTVSHTGCGTALYHSLSRIR